MAPISQSSTTTWQPRDKPDMAASWERSANHWDDVVTALHHLRRGGPVIVMDDESRENEGDLVLAAEFATRQNMAFLCRHSSGLLCAPMTAQRAKELELGPMVSDNTDRNQTAFTVSVDVIHDTTTGASAGDRAITATWLANPAATPTDFSRPGHLFPLVARDGGVLERTGHTEASVDLCILAGCTPVAVIGELMSPDGLMMRLQACREFAARFTLPIINVEQIIAFRRSINAVPKAFAAPEMIKLAQPPLSQPTGKLQLSAECELPVSLLAHDALENHAKTSLPVAKSQATASLGAGGPSSSTFRLRVYTNLETDQEHLVLLKGDVEGSSQVLTRIHSVCLTGDVLGSLRCDCGTQLAASLRAIADAPAGILIYVTDQEGRGIGLTNKIRAYRLQQHHGLDTFAANEALGLPLDSRNYDVANAVLRDLEVQSVVLLTNNPLKVDAITTPVHHVQELRSTPHQSNSQYLEAKRRREEQLLTLLLQRGLSADGPKAHLGQTLQQLYAAAEPRSQIHEAFMERARVLALRGRASAPPNPWVGCVLVNEAGDIVGEGFHHRAGQAHAEVEAIRDAAQRYASTHRENYDPEDLQLLRAAVSGCTAYVTLEPCHHFGRTPPCDALLVSSGVRRVVIAVTDPDQRVNSAGVEYLREQGLEVVTDVLREEVLRDLQPYLHHRRHQQPFVVLKAACSLDSKVACPDGTSQWITNPTSRRQGHCLRAESQAILVGATTALVDDPQLTVRLGEDETDLFGAELRRRYAEKRASPLLRVLLDGRGRVTKGHILNTANAPTLIFTSAAHCSASSRALWAAAPAPGIEVVDVPAREVDGHVLLDLPAVLQELGRRGILQLLVEGGSAVQGQFLQQQLVNELHLFSGPKLVGCDGRAWPQSQLAATIADAQDWHLAHLQRHQNDVYAVYQQPVAQAVSP